MRKLFLLLLFSLFLANAFAQNNITLTTNDDWAIAGTFFQGTSENCVILLHDLEKSRAEFATITEKLRGENFSYLAIDLRGHGLSTNKGKYEEFEKTGEKIGSVGKTGLATGTHLHFEIKENGKTKDPNRFLQK